MSRFLLVSYYLLGGPYSMQLGSHVRMDLQPEELHLLAPPMWPIKAIMTFGIFLMLLQAISSLLMFASMLLSMATGQRVFGVIGFVGAPYRYR